MKQFSLIESTIYPKRYKENLLRSTKITLDENDQVLKKLKLFK